MEATQARFLSGDERRALLAQLEARWPAAEGERWHPLDACAGPDALTLETGWFERDVPHDVLAARLRETTGPLVYRLLEGTPHWGDDPPPSGEPWWRDMELPVEDARIAFGGSETLWVPPHPRVARLPQWPSRR